MKRSIRCVLTGFLCSSFLFAGIVQVPEDQPTIQAGINAAVAGDTVLVADGTYLENINYHGKAITVASHALVDGDTNHIANTIIDGSEPSHPDSGSVIFFISGEDTTSILYGFTITGGSGTITEYTWQGEVFPSRGGGGVFCYDSGARISSNTIKDNHIPYHDEALGAGVSALPPGSTAHIIIEGNQIVDNTATGWNAGLAGISLTLSGTIRNNEISFNTGTGTNLGWGAVGCWWEASDVNSVLLENNRISHNQASAHSVFGGGLYIQGGTGVVVSGNHISHNTLDGNTERGGGIFVNVNTDHSNTMIVNNIISGNSASGNSTGSGGGLYILGSAVQMINNTIVQNISNSSGGGLRVEASPSEVMAMNNIFWGNEAPLDPQISGLSGLITVRYSDVEGGWGDDNDNNIDEDPSFVDTLDFHLTDASKCIGAGIDFLEIDSTAYNCPTDDIDGNPRPNPTGSMPDIGAWESPAAVSGIEDDAPPVAREFSLAQNYPNPFNPTTTISFQMPTAGGVSITVYDIVGREVKQLAVGNWQSAGSHAVSWDGTNDAGEAVSSGIYFYRLTITRQSNPQSAVHIGSTLFTRTRKMLLSK